MLPISNHVLIMPRRHPFLAVALIPPRAGVPLRLLGYPQVDRTETLHPKRRFSHLFDQGPYFMRQRTISLGRSALTREGMVVKFKPYSPRPHYRRTRIRPAYQREIEYGYRMSTSLLC